jgi:hypothetical protein
MRGTLQRKIAEFYDIIGKGKQILKDVSVRREKPSPWGKSGGSQMLIAGVFERCENSAFL